MHRRARSNGKHYQGEACMDRQRVGPVTSGPRQPPASSSQNAAHTIHSAYNAMRATMHTCRELAHDADERDWQADLEDEQ